MLELPEKYDEYSFSSFIKNNRNETAYKICLEYSRSPKGFLVLYGDSGVGKTLLAVSILKSFFPVKLSDEQMFKRKKSLIVELEYFKNIPGEENKRKYETIKNYFNKGAWQYRRASSIYLKSINLAHKLHELSVKNEQSLISFINNILRYDCILFDDLGSEKFSEAVRQNFYYLIDECYTNEKPMIITSNESIMEINQKEPRIASRLSEGLIIHLQDIDHRLNKAIGHS